MEWDVSDSENDLWNFSSDLGLPVWLYISELIFVQTCVYTVLFSLVFSLMLFLKMICKYLFLIKILEKSTECDFSQTQQSSIDSPKYNHSAGNSRWLRFFNGDGMRVRKVKVTFLAWVAILKSFEGYSLNLQTFFTCFSCHSLKNKMPYDTHTNYGTENAFWFRIT